MKYKKIRERFYGIILNHLQMVERLESHSSKDMERAMAEVAHYVLKEITPERKRDKLKTLSFLQFVVKDSGPLD